MFQVIQTSKAVVLRSLKNINVWVYTLRLVLDSASIWKTSQEFRCAARAENHHSRYLAVDSSHDTGRYNSEVSFLKPHREVNIHDTSEVKQVHCISHFRTETILAIWAGPLFEILTSFL